MTISSLFSTVRVVPTICAVTAAPVIVEMASRTVRALAQETQRDVARHLGGTLFYSLCALNLVPHSGVVGAAFFVTYALYYGESGEYATGRAVYTGVKELSDRVIVPLWNEIIHPVFTRVINAIWSVLERITLPRHPVWYGVALIVTAIWFKYGLDFPALAADIHAAIV